MLPSQAATFPPAQVNPLVTSIIHPSEYIFRRPIFSRLNLRLILRQLFTRPNRRPLNKSKSLEVNLVVTSIIGPSEYIFRRFKTESGTYFETIFYETKSVLIKVLRRIQLLHPSSALQSTDPRESWLLFNFRKRVCQQSCSRDLGKWTRCFGSRFHAWKYMQEVLEIEPKICQWKWSNRTNVYFVSLLAMYLPQVNFQYSIRNDQILL